MYFCCVFSVFSCYSRLVSLQSTIHQHSWNSLVITPTTTVDVHFLCLYAGVDGIYFGLNSRQHLALMPSLCQFLKTLQKSKALILTMRLIMQKLGKQLEMIIVRSTAPTRARIPERINRRVSDRCHGSVVAPHRPLAIGKQLAFTPVEYFTVKCLNLLFLNL